jgi:hypothetical protein
MAEGSEGISVKIERFVIENESEADGYLIDLFGKT